MNKLKDIEKEYKIKFDENPEMTLQEWLKRKGLKSLLKALKRAETKSIKKNYDK